MPGLIGRAREDSGSVAIRNVFTDALPSNYRRHGEKEKAAKERGSERKMLRERMEGELEERARKAERLMRVRTEKAFRLRIENQCVTRAGMKK